MELGLNKIRFTLLPLHHHKRSELARNTSPVRASSLFFLAYKRAIYPCAQVRRRPQPTLSPAPSPERNDRLANLYPPSDICPYGEAPLVTTCGDTAKSVSFGFLCSRQGSELARDIISSNAFLYLPILAATACTSSVRAGSAACGAGRFRPSPPPGTCQTSLPNAPHLYLPTLMAAGNIFHG